MITYNGPILVSAEGVELYSHGTAAFPCGCYFNDPRSNEVPFHWHDECEVVVVQEGELLYLAGGERYVLRKGDAVFVNGGVPHAEQAIDNKSAMEGDLVFHPRLLYGDKTTALWINYFRHLAQPGAVQSCALRAEGEPWEREAATLCARAFEAIAYERQFFEAVARDCLTHATLLVFANHPLREETVGEVAYTRSVDRLKGMIGFIEEHFAEEITVDQIARRGQRERARGAASLSKRVGSPSDGISHQPLALRGVADAQGHRCQCRRGGAQLRLRQPELLYQALPRALRPHPQPAPQRGVMSKGAKPLLTIEAARKDQLPTIDFVHMVGRTVLKRTPVTNLRDIFGAYAVKDLKHSEQQLDEILEFREAYPPKPVPKELLAAGSVDRWLAQLDIVHLTWPGTAATMMTCCADDVRTNIGSSLPERRLSADSRRSH